VDHPAVIRRAACEKVEVVRRDPFERGERALLNFGHTVGHALEAASGYRLSHGQAISAGMVAEAWLGEGKGWCSPDVLPKLIELLDRFGLPTGTPPAAADLLLHFLWQDKKRAHGQIRLALPTVAGDGAVFSVEEADIRAALDYIMARHAPEGVPAGGAV
jgi:3-dehydroquinate synthetase